MSNRYRVTDGTTVEILDAKEPDEALSQANERWANHASWAASRAVADLAPAVDAAAFCYPNVEGDEPKFCFACWLVASPVRVRVAQLIDGSDIEIVPGSEVSGYLANGSLYWSR